MLDAALPQGPACDGASRPCWQTFTAGFRLLDPNGGLSSVRLARGSGRSHALLHEVGAGRCWGVTFAPEEIERNIAGTTAQGGVRDGHLVAQVR